jgi:6-pyruvoyltetrahydropterin/6-carboxytetrahydropterin synthase
VPAKKFAVDLCKQQLTFSAAHFITFAGSICERLHGHNYGVSCRIEGPLDVNRYVIDFIALRDQLQRIALRLDHHVLLPTLHPQIHVFHDQGPNEVIATFEKRRWVFPAEDCVLLPVSNTTAEEIASYFVDELLQSLGEHWRPEHTSLTVRIDENQGQWGECRWEA